MKAGFEVGPYTKQPPHTKQPPRYTVAIILATLAVLVAFLQPGALAAQERGQVGGRVVAADGGQGLEGVQIHVQGTSIGTLTDARGRFLLPRVPSGDQTLVASYIGREDQTSRVRVPAGGSTEANFSLPVSAVALEGLEVLGLRAMTQARALSVQKNSANIVNVVASDQMGRFPDASAPEALQRIPGIAVERDQGEGRYVQIRGGRSEFTQINLNGASVPSPEGEERQVALDAVPVDILESIEVAKAITPDMDASAIGGAVNLRTRAAPETRLLSLEAAGGFAPIREDPSGKASLNYGDRFVDGQLGVLFSGSFSNRQFGSDDIEPEYDFGGPGLADDALVEFQTRYYTLERERIGGTGALDYRLSPTSNLRLSGSYAVHKDTEERRVFNNVVEDGELVFEHKNRHEELEISTITADGDHVLGSGIELTYGASWSRSLEDTPFDTEVFFLQEGVTFSPDMSNPDRIQPNPASFSGPYLFDEVEDGTSLTTNTDRIAHVDLMLPYELGAEAVGDLKVGFQIRDKDKDQSVDESAGELTAGAPDMSLADVGEPFDISGFNPGTYPFAPFSTAGGQVKGFLTEYGSVLAVEADVEADSEDYDLDERVTAGYVMTELSLTPDFMILPGVRYEHTDFDARGFEFDPDTETLTPTTGEKSYDNFFPMAHVRYRIGEQTNVRAAYTTGISRPNFFDLVPYRIRDDEDLEIGNPDLEPTTSDNFDLMVEHYDARIGVISAGLFAKLIEDPIFFFVSGNSLGGETVQPANGESGEIFGAELALQQQLRFLPAPFDGLGVYANYTYTSSEGVLPDGREAPLLGQADHAFNAALSYERFGFSGQLSLNFVDDYVDEYGEAAVEDVHVGSRHQLDFSASYQVTPEGAVFVELLNLTNQPFTLFQGVDDRPRQIEYYEAWGSLGFRYTLN